MAAHPDIICYFGVVIGSPFAKAVLKEHFPPRFLMSGSSEGFYCFFSHSSHYICCSDILSFSWKGGKAISVEEEESSVLCLSGQLCPSLNLGIFEFPTAPGLSSSLSGLHPVLQQLRQGCTCAASRERVPHPLKQGHPTPPVPMSVGFSVYIPLSHVTFPSANRASSLCIIRRTEVHKAVGLVGRDHQSRLKWSHK